MTAVARTHIHLVASAPLFERASAMAHAELDLERQAKAAARERDLSGDERLKDLDLDGFLEGQLAVMQSKGHWARVTRFNSTGNHSALIQYVPVAGEEPRALFGVSDYVNTVSLQVWSCRDGSVYFEVHDRNGQMAKSEKLQAARVTRQTIERAFAAFVRLAVRHAAKATRH